MQRSMIESTIDRFENKSFSELIKYLEDRGVKSPVKEIKKLGIPYAYSPNAASRCTIKLHDMIHNGVYFLESSSGINIKIANNKQIRCRIF